MSDQYFKTRLEKVSKWAERQSPYPGRFDKSHTCEWCHKAKDGQKDVRLAGRILSLRIMGKIAFLNLQDHTGKLQVAFKGNVLGKDEFKFLTKNLDVGDYIGVTGEMFTTQKGERTLNAEKVTLLSKGLRPLPEKWHGLQDAELKVRCRYLDLIMDKDVRKRFELRNQVTRFLREYLNKNDFFEVETPVLQSVSCGASARPFVTHHNALDIPLYLRIAPETFLKRLIVGGYERVYEIGPCFRNEGVDPSHLQEFTMLEFYAAYWDYRDNMRFIKSLIQEMVQKITGSLKVNFQGTELDFSGDWKEYKYHDLVFDKTKIDLTKIENFEHLQSEVKSKLKDIPLEKYVGFGSLVDAVYKKYCRDHLIQPCFLTNHPEALVPLARRSDKDSKCLDLFQVLVNGWEVVKAYSELVDPVEQRKRLEEQAQLSKKGDKEAMMMDEDFLLSMEYGMPPMSGLGMGLERIICLLSDNPNVRDVIYFPFVRSEN